MYVYRRCETNDKIDNIILTGYGGGTRNKIALLEVESHNLEEYKLPKEK